MFSMSHKFNLFNKGVIVNDNSHPVVIIAYVLIHLV